MPTQDEHKGPLYVIVIFGLMALGAVGIAGALAIQGHQMEVVLAFTGLATTVGAWLAPSPMTKLPAPPTPPGALLVSGEGSNDPPAVVPTDRVDEARIPAPTGDLPVPDVVPLPEPMPEPPAADA